METVTGSNVRQNNACSFLEERSTTAAMKKAGGCSFIELEKDWTIKAIVFS